MLLTEVSSAICVQRFDDSRNSAIHTTYRISLRSSSMRKPRYPLLRVVICFGAALFRAGPLWLQSVVCLGCELDRGWPSRTHPLFRKSVPTPLVPHPPTRGPKDVFQRSGSPWWGPAQRARTVGFAVWLLIDSMILPQVHLRNGEEPAG